MQSIRWGKRVEARRAGQRIRWAKVGVNDSGANLWTTTRLLVWPVRDERAYTTVVCEFEVPYNGENTPKLGGMFD